MEFLCILFVICLLIYYIVLYPWLLGILAICFLVAALIGMAYGIVLRNEEETQEKRKVGYAYYPIELTNDDIIEINLFEEFKD